MDTRALSSRYALIGTLDGLSDGVTDITALYVAKHGAPQAGAMLALQLVPVADTGIRGLPLLVTGLVTALGDPSAAPLHLA